jgi:hypothetical protein
VVQDVITQLQDHGYVEAIRIIRTTPLPSSTTVK